MPSSYECDICENEFNDTMRLPKVLQCQHTFCLECLLKIDANGLITCPMDRKAFNVDIATDLPDNLYIKARLENTPSDEGTPRKRFRGATDSSTQTEADNLQLLQLACLVERQKELLAALRSVRDGVLAALEERVQTEEKLLERARDCIMGLLQQPSGGAQELRDEVAGLLLAGAALEQDLRILQPGLAAVSAEGGWHSKRVQLSEQPALQLAALQLRQQGSLEWEPSQQEQQAKQEPCRDFTRLDVEDCTGSEPGELEEDKKELLVSTAPVHCLTYVWCSKDPDFSLSLLRKHAADLEELHLYAAGRSHLLALQGMRRLRKLQVRFLSDKSIGALPAPLLTPAEGSGLTWLQLLRVPRHTARSLIAVNGHSLRKLRLGVGPPPKQPLAPPADDWFSHCQDLEVFLRGCRLQRLESLTLVREKRCHNPSLCEAQLAEARRALPPDCRARCTFCRVWVNGVE